MNEYKKKQITHKIFSVIYAIILLFIGITEGKSTTIFNKLTQYQNSESYFDKTTQSHNEFEIKCQYLQKNIVNGQNLLLQNMIQEPNTTYIIQYNYNLNGQTITIPENCTLIFQQGSINNGKIVGNNTIVSAEPIQIFNIDVELNGTWNISESYPEWFGAKGNDITDDTNAIQKAINVGNKIIFRPSHTYIINTTKGEPYGTGGAYPVALRVSNKIVELNGATLKMVKSLKKNYYAILVDGDNVEIKNGSIIGDLDLWNEITDTNGGLIAVRSTANAYKNIRIHNLHLSKGYVTGIIITGNYSNEDIMIYDNIVENCGREGIFIENAKNIIINNNIVKNCNKASTKSGIGCEPFNDNHYIENLTISNNILINNGWHGIYLFVNGSCLGAKNVVITNNSIEGSSTDTGGISTIIVPNLDSQNNPLESRKPCDITLTNNTIKAHYGAGFIIFNGETKDKIIAKNNTIILDNTKNSGYNYGIRINRPTNHGLNIPKSYNKLYNIFIDNLFVTKTTKSYIWMLIGDYSKFITSAVNCYANIKTDISQLNCIDGKQPIIPSFNIKIDNIITKNVYDNITLDNPIVNHYNFSIPYNKTAIVTLSNILNFEYVDLFNSGSGTLKITSNQNGQLFRNGELVNEVICKRHELIRISSKKTGFYIID